MNDELWSLFAAWQAGDREAGSELLDRCFPRVARFFRNKVSRVPDDDDLVQKTFLALQRAQPRSTAGSFWALLYGIARNVLREYIREKHKRSREQDDFAAVCVHDLDPRSASSIAMRTTELRAFVEALRRIPVRDQIVLELRYFEGLKAREIAELAELPRGSVHRALDGALERLREAVAVELASGRAPVDPPAIEALEAWAAAVRAELDLSSRRACG